MNGEISGHQQWGLYADRLLAAGTFLALAYGICTEIALRYAVIIIAILQLYYIVVAKKNIAAGKLLSPEEPEIDNKLKGDGRSGRSYPISDIVLSA